MTLKSHDSLTLIFLSLKIILGCPFPENLVLAVITSDVPDCKSILLCINRMFIGK